MKDVIIIRGENHYPQDIETAAAAAHLAFDLNFTAAFTVDDESEEKLIVVQEVARDWRHPLDHATLLAAVRKAVVMEFDLHVADLVLIRADLLPKTPSGKVQRRQIRDSYLNGRLPISASLQGVAAPPKRQSR